MATIEQKIESDLDLSESKHFSDRLILTQNQSGIFIEKESIPTLIEELQKYIPK